MPSKPANQSFIDSFEDVSFNPPGVRLPEIKIPERYIKSLGLDPGISTKEFLRIIVREGLKKKGVYENKEYTARAKREFDILDEVGFIDYILLVWDVINFCHENDIPVGKGRGSAAGSLILYLIGVTGIDPIENGLIFERFISKARAKSQTINGILYIDGQLAPDIDVDLCTVRRGEVIEYLKNKYDGHFCKLPTISTLATRQAVKDVAKIYGNYSEDFVLALTKNIPTKFGQPLSIEDSYSENEKFKEFVDNNPDLMDCAKTLEGMMRQKGSHASAFLISYEKLDDFLPCEIDTHGELTCSYDMNYAQEESIKLDLLGLHGVTLVDNIEKALGLKSEDFDPNDPFIYEMGQLGDLPYGLFQIGADANYRVYQEVKPKNWSELSDVISLARPGSMAFIGEYIANQPNDYWGSKEMQDLLSATHNVPIYQETVLFIASKVFGFTLEDAEQIRRATAKKKAEEVAKWRDRIYEQREKLNLPMELADFFWKVLEMNGNYGFNKCLSPATLVECESGQKKIKEIEIGDLVKSFSIKESKNIFSEVKDVIRGEAEMHEFELSDGSRIICSMEHKVLTSQGMLTIKSVMENNLEIIGEDIGFFKPVPGFEKHYVVSNRGGVRSLDRVSGPRNRKHKGQRINPFIDEDGYERLMIQNKEMGRQKFFVHRLVAMAFVPNEDNLPCVNHKDGNKKNNHVENLEWISVADNNRHAYNTGLNTFRPPPTKRGESHGNSKLKEADIREIRKLDSVGVDRKKIATQFNIGYPHVWAICVKKSWKHLQ